MPPKRTTEVKYYTLTDSGYIEIDATPQELETYLEESQEWQRVRHGRWISESQQRVFKCSVCHNYLDFDGVNAGRGSANYCPNCGAKMDEIEERLIMPKADGSTIPKDYMNEVTE